jgi:hypothetical protein
MKLAVRGCLGQGVAIGLALRNAFLDPLAISNGLSQGEFGGPQRLGRGLGALYVLDDLDYERALFFVFKVTQDPAPLAALGF